MAAPQTATPGAAFPPARGSRSGAPLGTGGRRALPPTVHTGGLPADDRNSEWAAALTGATYRQLDYWIRNGILGKHLASLGSGRRRTFTDVDVEIVAALVRLAALGCRGDWLSAAAAVIRSERVRPGEWLIVTIAGHALRCSPHDLPRIVTHGDDHHTAWLVPLTAFDEGRPR